MYAFLSELIARHLVSGMRVGPHQQEIFHHGRRIGRIERLELAQGQLTLTGWVQAARLRLDIGEQQAEMAPRLLRADVAEAMGGAAQVGFALRMQLTRRVTRKARPRLVVSLPDGEELVVKLGMLVSHRRALRDLGRMTWRLLRHAPLIVTASLRRDIAALARVSREFPAPSGPGAGGQVLADLLTPGAAGAVTHVDSIGACGPPGVMLAEGRIDDPVALRARIHALRDALPGLRIWLLLYGTGEVSNAALAEVEGLHVVAASSMTVAANLAIRDHLAQGGGALVLMTRGAVLPPHAVSQLIARLATDPLRASVSTMGGHGALVGLGLDGEGLDLVTRSDLHPVDVAVPFVDGPCIAFAPVWLRMGGGFDPGLPLGQGAELDWALVQADKGARHVVAADLLASAPRPAHADEGGVDAVVAYAARLQSRHPGLVAQLAAWHQADCLAGARMAHAMAIAAAGAHGPVPIHLGHALGGGARHYLEARVAREVEAIGAAVIIEVGGARRWHVELRLRGRALHCALDDAPQLHALLMPLRQRQVIYSCGVGDPDPLQLPQLLLDLAGKDSHLEMQFHDFFPLSPSYVLLDSDDVHRGLPGAEADHAHVWGHGCQDAVGPLEWRAAWERLAARADELQVYSGASASLVAEAWPAHAARIRIVPHVMATRPALVQPVPQGPPLVVAVLGNISVPKGAQVVADLAVFIRDQSCAAELDLVVIGQMAPSHPLPDSVRIHGRYAVPELPQLVERYGITHWLIPSICPETFSLTTREAMATGLPVLVFDLGGQAEGAREGHNGQVLPLMDGAALGAHLLALAQSAAAAPHRAAP